MHEEEPEIVYPFTVTYHFNYRGANGSWKEVKHSQKVTGEDFNTSKLVSYFSKQITNNKLQTVSTSTNIYTWLGTWTSNDLGVTLSDNDKIYINTSLFQKDTDIYFYADYSVASLAHLTVNYVDNISHGSSSWHNEDLFEGYKHTFKTPANIPSHYEFKYWGSGDVEEQYKE